LSRFLGCRAGRDRGHALVVSFTAMVLTGARAAARRMASAASSYVVTLTPTPNRSTFRGQRTGPPSVAAVRSVCRLSRAAALPHEKCVTGVVSQGHADVTPAARK